MIQEKDLPKIQPPSRKALATAAVVSLVIATVLLFTIILPAEYGKDPLGTGAALGLIELSAADTAPQQPSTTTPAAPSATNSLQPKTYKADAQDFLLRPGDGFEFKYHMEKGATMVYAWKASGKVRFEFHGEPDQKPNKDYYDSYEIDDKVGKTESFGSFTAPSTGIHGWFWENKGDKDVELRLTTAGFYDKGLMFAGGPPTEMPVEDVK